MTVLVELIRKIGIVRLALLCVLVPSLTVSMLFLSLYFFTGSPETGPEVSNTVRGEGMSLTFSTANILRAGEEATFYIDITNERDEYVHRVDFVVTTRAVSLFNSKVFSTTGYSDRGYQSGKPERVVKETRLPNFTPPGRYAFEIVAKPEGLNSLPPARIVTYVQAPLSLLFYPFVLMVISGTMYLALYTRWVKRALLGLLRALAQMRERVDRMARAMDQGSTYHLGGAKGALIGLLRALAQMAERVDRMAEENLLPVVLRTETVGQVVEEKGRKYLISLPTGKKFVLAGICLLLIAALILSFGLEGLASDAAILAYLSLVIGVGNLLWAYFREGEGSSEAGPDHSASLAFSLFLFALFVYFSIPERILAGLLAAAFGVFSFYTYARYRKSLPAKMR